MNANTHTPGPWHTKPETDYVPAQVWADGMNVADVYGGSRDVRKANARLIAAAPELLQSANEMLACLSFIEPNAMRAQVMLRAQTAIAKAQGKV